LIQAKLDLKNEQWRCQRAVARAEEAEARVLATIHKANPDDEYETVQEGIEALISDRNLAMKNEEAAEARVQAKDIHFHLELDRIGVKIDAQGVLVNERAEALEQENDRWMGTVTEAIDRQADLAASLRDVQENMHELIKVAKCIHHWHDWGKNNEGMVVDSDQVLKLWNQTAKAEKSLARLNRHTKEEK
jgi:hypothetical protein